MLDGLKLERALSIYTITCFLKGVRLYIESYVEYLQMSYLSILIHIKYLAPMSFQFYRMRDSATYEIKYIHL